MPGTHGRLPCSVAQLPKGVNEDDRRAVVVSDPLTTNLYRR